MPYECVFPQTYGLDSARHGTELGGTESRTSLSVLGSLVLGSGSPHLRIETKGAVGRRRPGWGTDLIRQLLCHRTFTAKRMQVSLRGSN